MSKKIKAVFYSEVLLMGEPERLHRLRMIVDSIESSSKRVLLKSIHSMHDHKGFLEVIWRNNPPRQSTTKAVSMLWERLGNEDSENVSHYFLTNTSAFMPQWIVHKKSFLDSLC